MSNFVVREPDSESRYGYADLIDSGSGSGSLFKRDLSGAKRYLSRADGHELGHGALGRVARVHPLQELQGVVGVPVNDVHACE
jgi:hypothetical protein